MQTIISNASPLIILAKTNNLILLKNIFKKVIIPKAVYQEFIQKNDIATYNLLQADFIEVVEVEKNEILNNLCLILDKGEAEAILLAKSMNMIILIDEKKGRKIAKNLNLSVVGFLGILLINFKKEYISKNYIIEIIDKADKLGYRLSNTLKTDFLNNL